MILIEGLTCVINEHNLLKKNKLAISGDDIKEGLTCVLSTKFLIQNFHRKQKIS